MERTSSFGEWIRRQRKALDLTQQGLAERVNCSTAAIKKIESDERRPSRQVAERLADALALPAGQRGIFLDVARGLKPVDWLSLAHEPATLTSPSSLPTGTVTFLFTDIEGSTRLWAQSPGAMKAAHARHDEILREAIASNGGYVFSTAGDAFSAAFDTAGDALRAAVRAQAELQAESWKETPIRVRMGIHTGEAQLRQEGVYTGYVTLSHVQRLMSAASGGQVLISFTSQQLVQDGLPENVELRDLGRRQLKDWDQPEHIYRLVIEGLAADFPPLKTPELFPHNLPLQLTSFIGRERELAEASRLLAHARLLTLVGPGGIGKTRLSLQLAAGLLPSFEEGAWFVEIASLTDGAMLPRAIAAIFGLRELPNLPVLTMIIDYLRARPLLLILDNCEHLVDACAQLSDQLLHSCPQLKIIATSREGLGIAGETVYRVPPLSVPGASEVTREAALKSEAIQLFVERAGAAHAKFELTDQNAADVAQVCRQLDGIPLALELAAARIPVFSPREIAAHLEERFKLLVSGSRTALDRHRTLQALIDWSYDLLLDEERALFCQLSVFAGSFTFEAAAAVCSGLDVFDLLPRLINKSLVMPDEQANGTRYLLIETICQYAESKLLQAGEWEAAHRRHAEFFLKFAQSARPHFDTPRETEWLSRLEAEEGNLRTALEWGLEQDPVLALRLATALYLFWGRRGYDAEGSRMLRRALASFRSLPAFRAEVGDRERMALEAKALNALAVLGLGVSDPKVSEYLEESVRLSRQTGEKRDLAGALTFAGITKGFAGYGEAGYALAKEALALAGELGDPVLMGLGSINFAALIAMMGGDLQEAKAYTEEGIRLLSEAGAQWAAAMALMGIGIFATRQGDYAEARSRFEACIPLFETLGDRHRLNMLYSQIAHLERYQGQFEQAQSHYRETLLEWQRLGHRAAIAHELECLAFIAKVREDDRRAGLLLGAAEMLREKIGIPMTPVERPEYDRELADLRRNVDEAAFGRAWAEGRTLSMEQAITLATENY